MSTHISFFTDAILSAEAAVNGYRDLVVDPLEVKVTRFAYLAPGQNNAMLRRQVSSPVIGLDATSPRTMTGADDHLRFMDNHPQPQRGIVIVAPWYQRGLAVITSRIPEKSPLRTNPAMKQIALWLDRCGSRSSVYLAPTIDDALIIAIYLSHQFVYPGNPMIKEILSKRHVTFSPAEVPQ